MYSKKLDDATKALLEILHIISYDGFYSDEESLIEILNDLGVDPEIIKYHQKRKYT